LDDSTSIRGKHSSKTVGLDHMKKIFSATSLFQASQFIDDQ